MGTKWKNISNVKVFPLESFAIYSKITPSHTLAPGHLHARKI